MLAVVAWTDKARELNLGLESTYWGLVEGLHKGTFYIPLFPTKPQQV